MPDIRNVDAGPDRQLLVDAARRIIADQHTSVTRVQQTLHLGYARAYGLLDLLEDAGVVGPFGQGLSRPVLVRREDSTAVIAVLSQELEVPRG
jgi:S-DNA-T family DNA segregation ATPase FtsK/SpoIIIE